MTSEDVSIVLVVDTRENAITTHLNTLGTSYVREQLGVGDFILRRGSQILCVFERKTPSDLNSSILSNRHRQQRERLLQVREAEGGILCGYILEGINRERHFKDPLNAEVRVQGAIENLVVRDRLVVLPTKDSLGTAKTLVSLVKKWTDGWGVGGTARLQARKDKTGESVFYHQLSVIPGVGEKCASQLAEQFGNCKTLIDILLSEDGLLKVASVVVGGRKVGQKVAQRIHDAFVLGKCN